MQCHNYTILTCWKLLLNTVKNADECDASKADSSSTACNIISSGNLFASLNQIRIMNVKRLFGIILTVLGISALIYTAIVFMNASGGSKQVKSLIVYGVLGAIFFFTGIGLIKGTSDDARPPV